MWSRLSALASVMKAHVLYDLPYPNANPRPVDGPRVPPERTRPHPAASNSLGLALEGPGFRVWDEDRHRAREWAQELSGARMLRRARGGPG